MRTGTFGYLPQMTRDEVRAQISSTLERGMIPAVEFTARPDLGTRYWSMWKLPLFGVGDPEEVLAEIDACAAAQPGCWIRVVGYDPAHGALGTAFLVVLPEE